MSGTAVEVVIGIILILLLLSALVSGINEVIEAFIGRRADYLEAGLVHLLGPILARHLYSHPLIQGLHAPQGPPKTLNPRFPAKTGLWFRSLLNLETTKRPSYLPAETFSQAMLSILTDSAGDLTTAVAAAGEELSVRPFGAALSEGDKILIDNEVMTFVSTSLTATEGTCTWTVHRAATPAAHQPTGIQRVFDTLPTIPAVAAGLNSLIAQIPEQHVRTALMSLCTNAENDVEKWRKDIENWFNGAMDRLSGWYKRRTKPILFFLGLAVVVVLNADTAYIGRTLWTNPALRQSVVTAAEKAASSSSKGAPASCVKGSATQDPVQCAKDELDQVKALQIPFGWPDLRIADWGSKSSGGAAAGVGAKNDATDPRVPHNAAEWWLKVAGLLATALALTLGAPFWFDLLNKFINFRATGSAPVQPSPSAQAQSLEVTVAGAVPPAVEGGG